MALSSSFWSLQRQTSAKDGARPDIFTEHFAQRLFSVYTIVSWSLLLSFGVAAMAVLLSSIAFDEIAAALICSAFVLIAVAVCLWLYWRTQGYRQNPVVKDPGAEYVDGTTKSLVYKNPMVHV